MFYDNPTKEHRKKLAPWERMKYDALKQGLTDINYFWYVVKHDIVENHEVPEWAGLIKVFDDGRMRIIKTPLKLKKGKSDFEFRYKMARKMTYRYWDNRPGA